MSELDIFEENVNNNIELLSSGDARTRRKAARWLGEAGEPSAVIELRKLYEQDPDRKVRKAAGDALGMLRALEQGLDQDQTSVYDLLEDVQLRGKLGKRVPIPIPTLARLSLALLVSLLILLAFNFIVWPQMNGTPVAGDTMAESAPDAADMPDRATALSDLQALSAAFRQDATTLQGIYLDFANLNCDATFSDPRPYTATLSGENADLGPIAARLNGQVLDLTTAKAPYNTACAGGSALDESQIAAPLSTLDSIIVALDSIDADLAAANG
jgi:hypothetical protein